MTGNYTPGPWEADELNCIFSGGRYIANCHPGHSRDAENEANARLIAAAPDLLEALHNMLADRPVNTPAVIAARAAIAKAEGRA